MFLRRRSDDESNPRYGGPAERQSRHWQRRGLAKVLAGADSGKGLIKIFAGVEGVDGLLKLLNAVGNSRGLS